MPEIPPYYCKVCKKAWQFAHYSETKRKQHPFYLESFPTIGCERKACPECEKQALNK